ncbi:MAG: DUF1592 domain-containing protein [Planctomycetaceae bacterium]
MPVRCVFALMIVVLFDAGYLSAADRSLPDFQREVLPVLQSHCVRCHGPEKQEARLRLDNLSTDLLANRAAAESWSEVRNALNAGKMPPAGEKPLSAAQREILAEWLSATIQAAVDARRKTSGRVVLRRLNRVEYQNTMFDLLDLEMDYARDFPPDPPSRDGFRNDGQSLQMSAIQLEYYLQTARRALDRVIVNGPVPQVYSAKFTESNVKGWLNGPERSSRLGRQQVFLGTIPKDYPETGEFLIRVKLTPALQPDRGFPLLAVSVGYRPDTKVLFREVDVVEVTADGEQVFEFRGRMENYPLPVRGQGKYPGLVVRVRNVYDDGSPLPPGKKNKQKGTAYPDEPHLPVLNIQSVEFQGPVFDRWPPANHRRILFDSDLQTTSESAYVADVLQRFMQRAWRRPVSPAEVQNMVGFFTAVRPEFPTFEEAVRETLAMVLIRPDFLYLMEPSGDQKRQIGDWELASRLSFFLWSTMPDDRLRSLAAAGTLRDSKVLAGEVNRLLNDPRSYRFVGQFTEQWLHLDVVDRVAVSRDYFPGFDDTLKAEMQEETRQFFAELLRENLSAMNLLSSDFTMLNEPLARHYGIEGVFGRQFRRVSLKPDTKRGGLLGQASVLLSNSTGSDSHAIRRAVWIRDRLLNDPPAPPPPDVPALDEADQKFLTLTIREQLEIHRASEACAKCHRSIDPWGIALENFNAVGLWRDVVRRRVGKKFQTSPVNSVDVLPDGYRIDGVNALKNYLITSRRDDFARALVTRLLTYALGRSLELSDRQTIDDLTESLSAEDYHLRPLILRIVASELFQTK